LLDPAEDLGDGFDQIGGDVLFDRTVVEQVMG
jgi:hypothetical protein